jgi:hypothetical protein
MFVFYVSSAFGTTPVQQILWPQSYITASKLIEHLSLLTPHERLQTVLIDVIHAREFLPMDNVHHKCVVTFFVRPTPTLILVRPPIGHTSVHDEETSDTNWSIIDCSSPYLHGSKKLDYRAIHNLVDPSTCPASAPIYIGDHTVNAHAVSQALGFPFTLQVLPREVADFHLRHLHTSTCDCVSFEQITSQFKQFSTSHTLETFVAMCVAEKVADLYAEKDAHKLLGPSLKLILAQTFCAESHSGEEWFGELTSVWESIRQRQMDRVLTSRYIGE